MRRNTIFVNELTVSHLNFLTTLLTFTLVILLSISKNHHVRELEMALVDMQDSLRKRNPDSVANLIRAATVSETVQEERRQYQQTISDLKQDLADAKESYDKKLRSLRQEHEKIKLQFETRLATPQNQQQQPLQSARVLVGEPSSSYSRYQKGPGMATSTTPSVTTIQPGNVKTLLQAQTRIRCVSLLYSNCLCLSYY